MQYVLLLRSVNLGKLRKVSMPELKKRLAALGYENVTSYINSGNLLFVSSRDKNHRGAGDYRSAGGALRFRDSFLASHR